MATSSKPREAIQRPHDGMVENMWIFPSSGSDPVDITNHGWGVITLTEDMFSPCVMGKIDIVDTINLPQHLHLVGDEVIIFTIGTPSAPVIAFVGRVTKVSERVNPTDASMAYVLEFISAEAIGDLTRKVRKSYSNMLYSDMVKMIHKEYLTGYTSPEKTLFVEDTLHLASIAIPGWSPFTALQKLAARSLAQDPTYLNASYLFFERLGTGEQNSGGYYFIPVEKVWHTGPVVARYVHMPKNTDFKSKHC